MTDQNCPITLLTNFLVQKLIFETENRQETRFQRSLLEQERIARIDKLNNLKQERRGGLRGGGQPLGIDDMNQLLASNMNDVKHGENVVTSMQTQPTEFNMTYDARESGSITSDS